MHLRTCKSHYAIRFHSVVVITFASHAKAPPPGVNLAFAWLDWVCTDTHTKVKAWSPPVSLHSLGRYNEGSHSFTCHPHIYPQVEWAIPAFTSQAAEHYCPLAGTQFPSHWGQEVEPAQVTWLRYIPRWHVISHKECKCKTGIMHSYQIMLQWPLLAPKYPKLSIFCIIFLIFIMHVDSR